MVFIFGLLIVGGLYGFVSGAGRLLYCLGLLARNGLSPDEGESRGSNERDPNVPMAEYVARYVASQQKP